MKPGRVPPVHFVVTAQVIGHFTIDQLQAALEKIRQKYPFVAGRIRSDSEGTWYDTEGAAPFPVRVTEGDWAAEAETELNTHFHFENGPLVRFLVVQNQDCTYLGMVCHHAFADGLSAAYILRDILTLMADPEREVQPLPVSPPADELLPPFETLSGGAPERTQRSPRHHPVNEVFAAEQLYVMPWALTQAQTSILVNRCRQERTSVHAALCVAFLVAHMQIDADGQTPIRSVSSPVNIRDRLPQPVGEQFGIYINSGVLTDLDCTRNRGFWEMAREVKASMEAESTNEKLFYTMHLFRQMIRRAQAGEKTPFMDGHVADYDISITNLGRLNFPADYGALHLDAIYGPAVNPIGREKILGVATVSGRLTFTYVAPCRLMDRPTAEAFKSAAMQELADATGW